MRQSLHLLWISAVFGVFACGSGTDGDGDRPAPGGAGTPATAGAPTSSGGGTAGGSNNVGMAGTAPSAGGGGVSSAGAGGKAGAPGTAGGGGTTQKAIPDFKFPAPSGADKKLTQTLEVATLDGQMARYVGSGDLGSGSGDEGQDPLIVVKPGGTLKNVILGAPAADGVHCEGSCTIENVWWEDVGEDAITLEGSSSSNVYRITGGGARKAADKVIQHNGAGTVYVKDFLVEDFGKLYRSCGNCDEQFERHSEFDTVVASGARGVLAGVNQKYKDSAKFTNLFVDTAIKICERYEGNDQGQDMSPLGSGADGIYCLYSAADISWH